MKKKTRKVLRLRREILATLSGGEDDAFRPTPWKSFICTSMTSAVPGQCCIDTQQEETLTFQAGFPVSRSPDEGG